MAHNALIFYAYLSLKQHNVHEQALLCHPWMSTSLLSRQFPLPETLNRQTPVLLCELAFSSRVSQTCTGASPLALTQPSHFGLSHSLFFPLPPSLLHVVTPSFPPISFTHTVPFLFTHYCHISLSCFFSPAPFTTSVRLSAVASTCLFLDSVFLFLFCMISP